MARSPRAVAFVGLVIAAALLDVAPRASADVAASSGNVDQYHYIVESGVGPGTSENLAPPRTPVGHVAPLGFFWVYPVGTSFTFSIDDFGSTEGSKVRVWMGNFFDGCMRVRSRTTIRGASPGVGVLVQIGYTGSDHPCFATAGIVTVTGVR